MKWLWRAGPAGELTLTGACALAAQGASAPAQSIKPPQVSQSARPAPALKHQSVTAPIEPGLTPAALRSLLDASELRLRQFVQDNRATGWLEKLWPALLGLLSVLVGDGINIWLHDMQRVATEKANRASAAFQGKNAIFSACSNVS